MPIAEMVRYAEMVRAGSETFAERRELLHAHREDVRRRLTELQETLTVLDVKIGFYETAAEPAARPVPDGAGACADGRDRS